MSAEINFDQDSISEEELRLLQTRMEIFQKLKAIFDGRVEKGDSIGQGMSKRGCKIG